jgi:GTP-binding protein EngB required for normal cell division
MPVSEPPAPWLAGPGLAGSVLARPGLARGVAPVQATGETGTAEAGTAEAGHGEPGAGPGQEPPPAGQEGVPGPAGAGAGGTPDEDGTGGPPAVVTLSDRLAAVGRMIATGTARSGPGGFSPALLRDASDLLSRAGERLTLSGEHTVVVLAGGTGSGKSSLFNRLAGADFSPAGVTRPMTREQHACVWGTEGAGPLLEWLGVPPRYRYRRSSALDEGERSLTGLVLLDLPDHDSVLAGPAGEVHQLIQLADLMIWVLDPQKYADAAVHNRYLVPMAGHSAVIAVVLNQADLLTGDEAEDCAADLRRLLESEGLPDAPVLLTSAVTGAGLGELRKLLTEAVAARRAVAERIGADVDAVAARFRPYAGGPAPAVTPDMLGDALARSAGVAGVGRALQSARELRAVDYVGWPVGWLADRISGRDPLRKLRLGSLWDELRGMSSGPAAGQQAEIDNALTSLADEAAAGLPDPWPATVRDAARTQAEEIPAALGAAITQALPEENHVAPWWRLVAAWQGLLLGCVVTAAAWAALIVVFGVFHVMRYPPAIFADVALLPWAGVMIAAFLLLGWLTAIGCMSLVSRAAGRERAGAEAAMRAGVAQVAQRMVLAPLERELAEYARFLENLDITLRAR